MRPTPRAGRRHRRGGGPPARSTLGSAGASRDRTGRCARGPLRRTLHWPATGFLVAALFLLDDVGPFLGRGHGVAQLLGDVLRLAGLFHGRNDDALLRDDLLEQLFIFHDDASLMRWDVRQDAVGSFGKAKESAVPKTHGNPRRARWHLLSGNGHRARGDPLPNGECAHRRPPRNEWEPRRGVPFCSRGAARRRSRNGAAGARPVRLPSRSPGAARWACRSRRVRRFPDGRPTGTLP